MITPPIVEFHCRHCLKHKPLSAKSHDRTCVSCERKFSRTSSQANASVRKSTKLLKSAPDRYADGVLASMGGDV